MLRKISVLVFGAFLFAACSTEDESSDGGPNPDTGPTNTDGQPSGNEAGTDGPVGEAGPPPVKLSAALTGLQVVPPILNTKGGGIASITVDSAKGEIIVDLTHSNLGTIIGISINSGTVGVNGQPIFEVAGGSLPPKSKTTLRAADVKKVDSILTFSDAATAVVNGSTYITILTNRNASGEVRGHIGSARLVSHLSGRQVAGPTTQFETGNVTVTTDPLQGRIDIDVTIPNLKDITGATINFGGPGINGPVLFDITDKTFTNTVSAVLTAKELKTGTPVVNFDGAMAAMLGGFTHVLVKTKTKTDGAVRGHLGSVFLSGVMSGGQHVPPITGLGFGRTLVSVDAEWTMANVEVIYSGFASTEVTAAHLHVGEPNNAGPIVFDLSTSTFASPLKVTVASKDLKSGTGITYMLFREAIAGLLAGDVYANVHTKKNTGGEIRGQIGTFYLAGVLAGKQVVPEVTTTAAGNAIVTISGSQTEMAATVAFTGLTSPTDATINFGQGGINGPLMFEMKTGGFTSPISIKLTDADLKVSGAATSFLRAMSQIINDSTYVLLSSKANVKGELRGALQR